MYVKTLAIYDGSQLLHYYTAIKNTKNFGANASQNSHLLQLKCQEKVKRYTVFQKGPI